jgi:hypothetical protein
MTAYPGDGLPYNFARERHDAEAAYIGPTTRRVNPSRYMAEDEAPSRDELEADRG